MYASTLARYGVNIVRLHFLEPLQSAFRPAPFGMVPASTIQRSDFGRLGLFRIAELRFDLDLGPLVGIQMPLDIPRRCLFERLHPLNRRGG